MATKGHNRMQRMMFRQFDGRAQGSVIEPTHRMSHKSRQMRLQCQMAPCRPSIKGMGAIGYVNAVTQRH